MENYHCNVEVEEPSSLHDIWRARNLIIFNNGNEYLLKDVNGCVASGSDADTNPWIADGGIVIPVKYDLETQVIFLTGMPELIENEEEGKYSVSHKMIRDKKVLLCDLPEKPSLVDE